LGTHTRAQTKACKGGTYASSLDQKSAARCRHVYSPEADPAT
jgi:hypothetical protein